MRFEKRTDVFKFIFHLFFVVNIIFLPNFFFSDSMSSVHSAEELSVMHSPDPSQDLGSQNCDCYLEQDDVELIADFYNTLKIYNASLNPIEIDDFHQSPFLSGLFRPPNLA